MLCLEEWGGRRPVDMVEGKIRNGMVEEQDNGRNNNSNVRNLIVREHVDRRARLRIPFLRIARVRRDKSIGWL